MINKRLRCREYIGSFVTAEVSKRINRIVALGDKATVKDMLKAFRFPEDLFITRLYSSEVLRYAENDSDMDFPMKMKYTCKGPNSIGAKSDRRIPIRQRTLHPSMLSFLDIAETSSSHPGMSGSLSPYNDMKSLYFDNSLYENEMHFKISKILDELNDLDDEYEELRIACDSEEEYNSVLDGLYRYGDGKVKMFGVSNNPMDIIIEKDPREGYRKFDEENLVKDENKDS